jgi:hypothetical protein
MESALEYLAKTHEELNKGGDVNRRRIGESNFFLALGIADRLLAEGKEPYLMNVVKEQGGLYTVCCCGDDVYDPFIGEPMPLKKYRKKAFNKKVEMNVSFTTGGIKVLLES